jgi:hypothetical protein
MLASAIYLPAMWAAYTGVLKVLTIVRIQHSSQRICSNVADAYYHGDELSNFIEDDDFLYKLKDYQLLKLDVMTQGLIYCTMFLIYIKGEINILSYVSHYMRNF